MIGKLILSVMVFAPGLIMLTVLGFVGLLALLEKTGIFASLENKALPVGPGSGTEHVSGPVVQGLNDALVASVGQVEEQAEATGRKTG